MWSPARKTTVRAQPIAGDFHGTERFLVQGVVGTGAYGVVYEAYDRERDELVALKVLRWAEADALYRFKKGFRALAELRHPNLVAPYELFTEGGVWFFTMELVRGCDFVAAVRAGQTPDLARLRRLLAQLAQGLQALHGAAILHRDVKPSNVLVDADDRLAVLDFGLISELGHGRHRESAVFEAIGTPAYMAPEQARGLAPTPASDWYGVGVMLYEALAGVLPFSGSLLELVESKDRGLRAPIAELLPEAPEDLAELTARLLDPQPERRLGGDEILRRLGAAAPAARASAPAAEAPFVGRAALLAELGAAFEASRCGAVAVWLRGASGMGKTALVDRFLDQLSDGGEQVVVLQGRCYPQESVPYKAVDSLVDALSRTLHTVSRHEAEVLLPTHVGALARLFPVLRRVEAVAEARERGAAPEEPQELRRRGFAALRELLGRLAARRPLVLWIDDLQWGDADSFELIEHLLRPPDAPALLFLGCYRREDADAGAFLRQLAERRASLLAAGCALRELEAAELSASEARELALAQLASQGEPEPGKVDAIVREAAGNPFFLVELARGAAADEAAEVELGAVLSRRIAALPEPERALLEVVAVAGRPVDVEVARQAAALGSEVDEALAHLEREKLVRKLPGEERAETVTYHDRIREAVLATLAEARLRALHRRLAIALESSGRAEPATLAAHYQATRDPERASRYAASAAARAAAALAFDHAAQLYRVALELLPAASEERFALQVRLGEAQANAGRSREAAETFLRTVREVGRQDPLDLQRRAAEKLLVSGQVEKGSSILRHVLRNVGFELDERRSRSLWRLRWQRLLLRLSRGEPRARAGAPNPRLVQRADVFWSASVGLLLVDTLRAAELHARHLRLALRTGEPARIARALALEIFFGALEGRDTQPVAQRAEALAQELAQPYLGGLIALASGLAACARGDWATARHRLGRAESELGRAGTDVAWELAIVEQFQVLTLYHLGRWRELFGGIAPLLQLVRERGDTQRELQLVHWGVVSEHLAADQPERAAAELERAARLAPALRGLGLGHWVAKTQLALYRGQGLEAWRCASGGWREVLSLPIQRLEMVRVLGHELYARAALAAALEEPDPDQRPRRLAPARAGLRRVARAEVPWAEGAAALLRAGIATLGGEVETASEQLEIAHQAFEAAEMVIHVQVVRRCRGLLETTAGRAHEAQAADAELVRLGVRNPEKLAAMLAPGRWG